jgi:hypothetical protein
MRITLVFESSRRERAAQVALRDQYERFARALGEYTDVELSVVADLHEAAGEDFVLLSPHGPLSTLFSTCDSNLPARVVLLGSSWQTAPQQLEKHKLAGLVDSLHFAEWMAGSPPRFGPYGRRELLEQTGAVCAELPFLGSVHYCLLQSEQHSGGLPHLLADYLRVYEQAGMMVAAEVQTYAAG